MPDSEIRAPVSSRRLASNASPAASSVALDRLLVVGEREEPGLELGGGRVDAAVEQRPAEAAVGLGVAGAGAGEVA